MKDYTVYSTETGRVFYHFQDANHRAAVKRIRRFLRAKSEVPYNSFSVVCENAAGGCSGLCRYDRATKTLSVGYVASNGRGHQETITIE